MPRISEIQFNDMATERLPRNEYVEIALSQEEYTALQSGSTEVRMALYQADGRTSFDFAIPLSSFVLDEDSNEWVALEYGIDYRNRTTPDSPANRWTISSTNAPNDQPPGETFFVAETIGVYTVNTSDGSVIDSDIISPVSDGTARESPTSGPLSGQPVTAVTVDTSTNTGSLQFNAPKKNDPVLAEPTPGDSGVICFTAGSLIRTGKGEIPIEELKIGDDILTMDMSYQKLRWIGHQTLNSQILEEKPYLRPIRIRAGALGEGHPERDLMVSPQHRILVNGPVPQRMFGADEVLVAAKHLLELDGIEIANDVTEVVYFHILFDQHQIVWANKTPAESLYTGTEALKTLHKEQLAEIAEIFPEIQKRMASDSKEAVAPSPARPFVIGRRGKNLTARIKNNKHDVFIKTDA